MATVSITRDWGDEGSIEIIVDVAESFPDAIAEAKASALSAFTEALSLIVVEQDET